MAKRYEPDTELDRRVRAALDAPPGAAERVARRALAEAEGERSRRWPRLAVSAAALVATLLLALGSMRALDRRRDARATAESPTVEARFAVTNRDGIVVVRSLDGGASSFHARSRRDPSPPGMMIIVLGETRP